MKFNHTTKASTGAECRFDNALEASPRDERAGIGVHCRRASKANRSALRAYFGPQP